MYNTNFFLKSTSDTSSGIFMFSVSQVKVIGSTSIEFLLSSKLWNKWVLTPRWRTYSLAGQEIYSTNLQSDMIRFAF